MSPITGCGKKGYSIELVVGNRTLSITMIGFPAEAASLALSQLSRLNTTPMARSSS